MKSSMKQTYLLLAVVLSLLLIEPLLRAQTVTNPAPTALVCAYNSVVPTPVSGQFFLVQCNSSGQILVGP